jgi:ribonuclease BN (tRNA processing enzyme)
MKILLLGTGTPTPSLRRQSSGYLFDTGKDVIVIDHGPGAHHRLLEAAAALDHRSCWFMAFSAASSSGRR